MLPHGTPRQGRAEVRRLAGLFAGQAGDVLSTSHGIMDDAPLENVIALYEEAAFADRDRVGQRDHG